MRNIVLALSCSCLAVVGVHAVETVWNNPGYKWLSEDGYWNDASNWEEGHQPTSFQGSLFDHGGTVRIPAATADNPFVEGSLFMPRVANFSRGEVLTIDGSGTYWLKQANPNDEIANWNYLNLVDFGGYFWGGEGHNRDYADDTAEFLATNLVLTIERNAADANDDGATLTLKQGYLNFYDPLGEEHTVHGHNFQLFHSGMRNLSVVYEEGTHTRTKGFNIRANGANQLFWIKGGLHEFFDNYNGKSYSNANLGYTRISGGVMDVKTGWVMPQTAGGSADGSYETVGKIRVDGTGTLCHTNNNTIYIGWGGAYTKSYLEMDDDAVAHVNNIQLGGQAKTWGQLEMKGNSRLDMPANYVMYVAKESDTTSYVKMDGNATASLGQVRVGAEDNNWDRKNAYGEVSLRGHAQMTVNNGLFVGRAQFSTGIVDVADSAFLTTRGGNIQLGEAPNAYGKLVVDGNAGLEHGHIYVGTTYGSTDDLIFGGNATNHVWNDNYGYALFLGKTSNVVGRAYFKDSANIVLPQVRVGGDDNNAMHRTARGEMYVQDNARVTVKGALWLGRANESYGLLNMSGGVLDTTATGIWIGNMSNALGRVEISGGSVLANGINVGNDYFSHGEMDVTGGDIQAVSMNVAYASYSTGWLHIGGDAKYTQPLNRIMVANGDESDAYVLIDGNAEVNASMWVGNANSANRNAIVDVKGDSTLNLKGEWLGLSPGVSRMTVSERAHLNLLSGLTLGWWSGPGAVAELVLKDDALLTGSTLIRLCENVNKDSSATLLFQGGRTDAPGSNVELSGTNSLFEVSGGEHLLNHVFVFQSRGYETTTNTLRIAGGKLRCNDLTVIGHNGQMGRVEVTGGEFSTREINLGYGDQTAELTSVMEMSGGLVTLENNGGDCYFQFGNYTGGSCHGKLVMTGGEIRTMCLRANHSASGSDKAYFNGGKISCNKVHNSWALVHGLSCAEVGTEGLTVDANGFSTWLNQEFTDAPDGEGGTVDGVVRITGNGSVDIRQNSYHAKTIIDGGCMSFSNGATVFGRSVQLVNGGVYSLEGAATSFAFDKLVLGDATSAGVLKLDQGDTIVITGEDGLEVNNCVLDVSHITGNGSYPVFVTAGSGTIDPAKLGTITLLSADPLKSYTLNENGEVVVSDREFSESLWTGAQSAVWGNDGNWNPQTPSGAESRANFGSAGNKLVQTTEGASVGVMDFTEPNYVVYGDAVVSVAAAIINESSGQVTFGSPVALGEKMTLSGTDRSDMMFSGALSGDGVVVTKTGSAKAIVSGVNDGLSADWKLFGGTLDFTRGEAFGAGDGTFELTSGTLSYSGSEPAVIGGSLVVSAPHGIGAIVDASGDLTVTNAVLTSGRLVKKGVGELKLDLGEGTYQMADTTDLLDNPGDVISLPASGDSPSSANMFNSLSVIEGTMVFEGDGSNATKVVHHNGTGVGEPFAQPQANPSLVLKNLYFDNYENAYFSVGRRSVSSEFNNPNVQIVDGAHLQAHKICVGWGAGTFTECGFAVTNASVYCADHFLMSEGGNSMAKVRVGPHGRIEAWNRFEIRQKFDVLVEGEGAEMRTINWNGRDDRYTWDGMLQFSQNESRGTMAFKNGGALTLTAHIHASNYTTDGTAGHEGVKLVFDGGSLNFLYGGTSMMARPQYQGIYTEGDGMTLSVAENAVHTLTIPIRGDGKFVKTGAGELVFADVRAMTNWPSKTIDNVGYFDYQYDPTDIVLGQYAGSTEVREGTLTVYEGMLTNTTDVTVGAAGTFNLAGHALSCASVSGEGLVRNGTLDATLGVVLDNATHTGSCVTFDGVTLDDHQLFDLTVASGEIEFLVPYTLPITGFTAKDMKNWRIKSGDMRLMAEFGVDGDGHVVLTCHHLPGTTVIVR